VQSDHVYRCRRDWNRWVKAKGRHFLGFISTDLTGLLRSLRNLPFTLPGWVSA
jgi:hypothetical protein